MEQSANRLNSGVTGNVGSDTRRLPEENYRQWCHGAVEHMAAFLGLHLSDDEARVWLDHFVKYPKWKIDKLINYSLDDRGGGRTLAHVCRYMDDLRPEPERARDELGNYKQLPYVPDKTMGREFFAYVKKLYADGLTPKQRDKIEMDFITAMRTKHPEQTWTPGRTANKGK